MKNTNGENGTGASRTDRDSAEPTVNDRLNRLEQQVEEQQQLIDSQREQLNAIADTTRTKNSRSSITRRSALTTGGLLALLGMGTGATSAQPNGRGQGGRGGAIYNWEQDVDARGNALLNLGGLNTEPMADGALINSFDGINLEIVDGRLHVSDPLDIETLETTELTGGISGGERIDTLAGENLEVSNGRLDALLSWQLTNGLLRPREEAVDGIEIGQIEPPDDTSLTVNFETDLDLSISGEQGSLRIESDGGHEIVLDENDGSRSLSVRDGEGNRVEMAEGEISISANSKISLDAPTIQLSAGLEVDIESGGSASFTSSALTDIKGSVINLNGGAFPAARVGDTVNEGVIQSGSQTVLIG